MPGLTRTTLACTVVAAALAAASVAQAQSVENFYKGKTVSMIIGYPPGGSNDLYAREVARFIGRHIPGNPNVVSQSMPGAGSLAAANHLYNIAAKDGTVMGLVAGPFRSKQPLAPKTSSSRPTSSVGSVASPLRPTSYSPGTHRR